LLRLLSVAAIAVFENLTQTLILHVDSFAVGSRWSAFQAAKAILSFLLYSKTVGEVVGGVAKSDDGDNVMIFGSAFLFIILYIVPSALIYHIFG